MATELKSGAQVTREVPTKCHDARKTGKMMVTIDHTLPNCPRILLRPKGHRKDLSITVDAIYSIIVKGSS